MKTIKVFIIILLISTSMLSPVLAGEEDHYKLEANAKGSIRAYIEKSFSDHFEFRLRFVLNEETNLLFGYGSNKFKIGLGTTFSEENKKLKPRLINTALTLNLPLSVITWKSDNLLQQAIDSHSLNNALFRQWINLNKSRWGAFNEIILKEKEKPKIFLGISYNMAPLAWMPICDFFLAATPNDELEFTLGCIIGI